MLRGPISRIISSGATLLDRDHARRRVRRELLGHHGIDRQHDLAAFGLRLGHDLARGRQELVLAQGLADGMPERCQEGIGHAAADDENIDLGEQVAEQVELGRYLGASHDRGQRTGRRLQHLRERVELFLHGAAGIGRQLAGRGLRPKHARDAPPRRRR